MVYELSSRYKGTTHSSWSTRGIAQIYAKFINVVIKITKLKVDFSYRIGLTVVFIKEVENKFALALTQYILVHRPFNVRSISTIKLRILRKH